MAGPVSSFNCPANLILEFQSIGNESPIALPWEVGEEAINSCFNLAQMVKRLPAMWKTLVQSLGWEDPLEKEMATHSNTLAWKIPWMEEHGKLQSVGFQRVGHD